MTTPMPLTEAATQLLATLDADNVTDLTPALAAGFTQLRAALDAETIARPPATPTLRSAAATLSAAWDACMGDATRDGTDDLDSVTRAVGGLRAAMTAQPPLLTLWVSDLQRLLRGGAHAAFTSDGTLVRIRLATPAEVMAQHEAACARAGRAPSMTPEQAARQGSTPVKGR